MHYYNNTEWLLMIHIQRTSIKISTKQDLEPREYFYRKMDTMTH